MRQRNVAFSPGASDGTVVTRLESNLHSFRQCNGAVEIGNHGAAAILDDGGERERTIRAGREFLDRQRTDGELRFALRCRGHLQPMEPGSRGGIVGGPQCQRNHPVTPVRRSEQIEVVSVFATVGVDGEGKTAQPAVPGGGKEQGRVPAAIHRHPQADPGEFARVQVHRRRGHEAQALVRRNLERVALVAHRGTVLAAPASVTSAEIKFRRVVAADIAGSITRNESTSKRAAS